MHSECGVGKFAQCTVGVYSGFPHQVWVFNGIVDVNSGFMHNGCKSLIWREFAHSM